MAEPPAYDDEELIALLQTDADRAIDLIFRQHYKTCHLSALRIVKDEHIAEDLVQEVFLELWRKRTKHQINTSLKAYLRRSAVNRSLNYIRDLKIKFDDEDKLPHKAENQTSALKMMETNELQGHIDRAIDSLPERCRVVFSLSRFEEMSYKEIAEKLDISIKTVENQISKALKILRNILGPHL